MVHTSWKSIDAARARLVVVLWATLSFMIRGKVAGVACLLIYLTAWLIL